MNFSREGCWISQHPTNGDKQMTDTNDVIKRALVHKRRSDNGSERSTYLLNDLLWAMKPQDRAEYFRIIEKEI